MSPRWKKAVADLLAFPGRSGLVILAIALGTWGIGSVLTSYVILMRDLRINYLGTSPPSATLLTRQALTPAQLAVVRAAPGIAQLDTRRVVMARVMTGEDTWLPLRLFVITDFGQQQLATFSVESGTAPGDGEILIERDSWRLMTTPVGEALTVRVKEGARRTLRISGKAHDPGLAPAHMDHTIYGYVRPETYRALVDDADLGPMALLVSVTERPFDREHIRAVSRTLRETLTGLGVEVERVDVPVPGHHPHEGQLASLLFLQGAIGLLSFVLCAILIVNIVSFLLARQVRFIGIMKAIGATPAQVAGLSYLSVAGLGLVAAAIGVPLGVWGGQAYARFAARELNFTIFTSPPWWVYVVLAATAVLMPVVVATVPILQGTRVTVLQALADHGLGSTTPPGPTPARAWLAFRPLRIALRAAFRRRGRSLFTIGTLALGLAIFAIALNLRATLTQTLIESGNAERYDLALFFGRGYSPEQLEQALADEPEVQSVALWQGSAATLIFGEGVEGNTYPVVSPPLPTSMLAPVMIAGQWLADDHAEGVVLNQALVKEEEGLRVGDPVSLRVRGATHRFTLVGITKDMGSPPSIYLSRASLAQLRGESTAVTSVRVVARSRERAAHLALARRLERRLEAGHFDVIACVRKADLIKMIDDHLKVITNSLLAFALLALLVAGLGLISTTSVNLIERTRELGVLRAIGANRRTLTLMLFAEGLALGMLGWAAGAVVAVPLSAVVSRFFGSLIFKTPLELSLSVAAVPLSFAVMALFVASATLVATAAQSQRSIRDALAYE